ncbi:MAG TPA: sortase [Anaerolineales bacterium]|nr:sortase [Anaerolineales bacterium]
MKTHLIQRVAGPLLIIALVLAFLPFMRAGAQAVFTTFGNGTAEPPNVIIGPNGAATQLDAFNLRTSTGTDTVTAVTVTLAPADVFNAIATVFITSNDGTTTLCQLDNPISNVVIITGCSIPVTTTSVQYKVVILPYSSGNMPPVPGASYATTGHVTGITATHVTAGSDLTSATVTIDNLSPANPTGIGGQARDTQIVLTWTNPADADYADAVVVRRAGSATDATQPIESNPYSVGDAIGTGTVACVVSKPAATCTDSGLTDGDAYYYRIFAEDTHGNYSDGGAAAGPFSPSNTNTTTPGTASAVATNATTIEVTMPYSDDANGNNTYTIDFRLHSASIWTNWVTNAPHTGSPFVMDITALTPSTSYDVRVTYIDPDNITPGYTNYIQTISGVVTPDWAGSSTPYTWTAPAHVTYVTVEAWGGGGKGANLTAAGNGGGGGGGGYSRKANIPVWPGTTYQVVVGAGSTIAGVAGGDSYFNNVTTVLAKGGSSATSNSATGASGGAASAGVGDVTYSGGTGANGAGNYGGGGGSSGGTGMNGFGGSASNGGTVSGGGSGGAGALASQGNGTAGSVPGGGGGGAYQTAAGSTQGGNGADGKVLITYVVTNDTSLVASCSPASIEEGYWTTCTATITRSTGTVPITGTVGWAITSGDTGTFTPSAACTLAGSGASVSCSVTYIANDAGSGSHVLQATYNGDSNYGRSTASTTVAVVNDVAPVIVTDGVSYLTPSGYVTLGEASKMPQPVAQIKVTFNKDVVNITDPTDANYDKSVTNPANYRLLFVQSNFTVRTTSCNATANTFDHVMPITSVTYSDGLNHAGPYVATITFGTYTGGDANFNNDQNFRLFLCGTTSITDYDGKTLAGDGTNEGTDFIRNFGMIGTGLPYYMPSKIPQTGFAPGRVTVLPKQPADQAYEALGPVWLEIPKLGVEANITGIPQVNGTWDVTWLNNDVGWLEGSAYPSLSGNSVLTGHYFNSSGAAGPFRYLGMLALGDEIIVHSYGTHYVYRVANFQQVDPSDVKTMLKHEDKPWLTLVTCVDYLANNDFKYRLIVSAEFVGIQ